jgi:quercetin dioxygenase-like cupin family protein
MKNTHIVAKGTHGVFHVLGPTVEFLTSPNDRNADFCVMKGTIPAGGVVPLHTHADPEAFFHLAGSLQVLSEWDGRLEWLDVEPGDFIEVPGNAKHAFRNKSSAPAIELITTTPKIGRFFQEVGKPLSESAAQAPPTPDELRHFAEVSRRYGYWNASPAENAAVGIILPGQ